MKNIIEYNKGLNEYQNFLTNYNEYDFYYNYHINTITKDDFQGVKNLRLVDTSWGNNADVLNANL